MSDDEKKDFQLRVVGNTGEGYEPGENYGIPKVEKDNVRQIDGSVPAEQVLKMALAEKDVKDALVILVKKDGSLSFRTSTPDPYYMSWILGKVDKCLMEEF